MRVFSLLFGLLFSIGLLAVPSASTECSARALGNCLEAGCCKVTFDLVAQGDRDDSYCFSSEDLQARLGATKPTQGESLCESLMNGEGRSWIKECQCADQMRSLQDELPENTQEEEEEDSSAEESTQEEDNSAEASPQEEETEEEPEENEGEEEPGEVLVVLFIILGLLIGGLLREVNKATGFPYSPMLLVVGTLAGVYKAEMGTTLNSAIEIVLQIDPEAILMIFIPTLIFESGFNMNWYVFKKNVWQVLLLAFPGVAVGAAILGVALNYVLGYSSELSFYGAMTAMSIVCATDPIAVGATLKELGAPAPFNVLLEGESLFNDGTAMVFFLIFSSLFKAEGVTVLGTIWQFCTLSIGGPLLGILFGLAASIWLRSIIRDYILLILVTFLSSYLGFYVGNFMHLNVSAILSVVCLGIFMSAIGKTKINPEAEHAVHAVWSFAQFCCETIIFILTGLIIGTELLRSNDAESTIVTSDWIKMVLFYFIMNASRWVMIQVHRPLLKLSGYPLTEKDILVLTYGGLRGAIAMCLALLVATDLSYDRRFRQLVIFYTTAMIFLTNMINGTTAKWFMSIIDFMPENKVRNKFRTNTLKLLFVESAEKISELAESKYLSVADWKMVNQLAGMPEYLEKIRPGVDASEKVDIEMMKRGSAIENYMQFESQDVIMETRFRFLRIFRGIIMERYEESKLEAQGMLLITTAIDSEQDNLTQPIMLWSTLFEYIRGSREINTMMGITNVPLIGNFAERVVNSHLGMVYDVLINFIPALIELKEQAEHLPMHKQFSHKVIEEIDVNLKGAEQYLITYQTLFNEQLRTIQNRKASIEVLEMQKHTVEEMFAKGTLEPQEYETLRNNIDKKRGALDAYTRVEGKLPLTSHLLDFPTFDCLSKHDLESLLQSATLKDYKPEQVLMTKDEPVTSAFLIIRGHVQMSYETFESNYSSGSLLTFANILSDSETSQTTAKTISAVSVYEIPLKKLRELMKENRSFEELVYKKSLHFLIKTQGFNMDSMAYMEETRLGEYTTKSSLLKLQKDEVCSLPQGGVLLQGSLKQAKGFLLSPESTNIEYKPVGLVPESQEEYQATSPSVILVFYGLDVKQLQEIKRERGSMKKSFRGVTSMGSVLALEGSLSEGVQAAIKKHHL